MAQAEAAGHHVLGVSRRAGQPASRGGVLRDLSHEGIADLVQEFDPAAIVHAAGSASVAASFESPLDDLRAQLLTWGQLLDSVRASGRQPVVVFPSSAAVYGNPRELPVDESAPCAPLSPYGFHKQACELLAREYASCFGLRVVVARLFSIFGPGQRRLLVWDLFRRLAANPATVSLDGTGAESRDYLHVDDAMRALLALTGVDTPAGAVLVTNVASGEETPIRELALVVREMLGSGSDVVWSGRSRAGDPVRWCADTRHLGELLPGWRPEPLRAGLRRCIDAWEGDRP